MYVLDVLIHLYIYTFIHLHTYIFIHLYIYNLPHLIGILNSKFILGLPRQDKLIHLALILPHKTCMLLVAFCSVANAERSALFVIRTFASFGAGAPGEGGRMTVFETPSSQGGIRSMGHPAIEKD